MRNSQHPDNGHSMATEVINTVAFPMTQRFHFTGFVQQETTAKRLRKFQKTFQA